MINNFYPQIIISTLNCFSREFNHENNVFRCRMISTFFGGKKRLIDFFFQKQIPTKRGRNWWFIYALLLPSRKDAHASWLWVLVFFLSINADGHGNLKSSTVNYSTIYRFFSDTAKWTHNRLTKCCGKYFSVCKSCARTSTREIFKANFTHI